jgi:hypothetical protein
LTEQDTSHTFDGRSTRKRREWSETQRDPHGGSMKSVET